MALFIFLSKVLIISVFETWRIDPLLMKLILIMISSQEPQNLSTTSLKSNGRVCKLILKMCFKMFHFLQPMKDLYKGFLSTVFLRKGSQEYESVKYHLHNLSSEFEIPRGAIFLMSLLSLIGWETHWRVLNDNVSEVSSRLRNTLEVFEW